VSFREPNGAVMKNMKPKDGASIEAPSLRGLQGRSATGLNGQAAKDEVSAVWQGLDAGKYFWCSGREKYFSLDIPFNRTSAARSGGIASSSVTFCDMSQISQGKFDRLRRTTAGFTTSALDGYGLRKHWLARPPP
jgi:hypothetical protein